MNLLNDFENCLERIRAILNQEQAETHNEFAHDDDDQWVDVEGEEETQEKQRKVNCDDAVEMMNRVKSLQNMVDT